ncbi:MAG: CBS domain-containing protein [Proteobacteria bacterium]|nr:CBS domain-containing protein [Pseudomonadota bacterium]
MRTPLSVLLKDKGSITHSISPVATGYECTQKLNQSGVGALLVIENGKLIGIISERDLIRKVLGKSIDPNAVKVSELMTHNPTTVLPSTTVQEAMKLITEKRFRHLPVVENGVLLGVISIGDLTRWVMLQQEYEIAALTGYIHGNTR